MRVGDTIVVLEPGDADSRCMRLCSELRPQTQEFRCPTPHPSCGSPVVREEGEVAYRCVSIDCPAQAVERLIHWGSRNAMDIDGLGDELVAV